MEQMLIDERTAFTARASDPATGNMVLVGRDVNSDRLIYRVNGGPWEKVPMRMLVINRNPTRVAMELLYEQLALCKATDNEEMTLP